jgi:Concanavalin A-like lectin/glucanases superfamily/Domain of unknown function (DUF2341)/Fibrinogen beta and gamma chains, C-terminal globular domain
MPKIVKKIKNIINTFKPCRGSLPTGDPSLRGTPLRVASILIIAIIIVVGLIYIFNKPVAVEAGWWNDGWRYRQTIAVANSGSAQTNTQVKILSGVNLDSLTPSKLQDDLDDMRFTDINGNILKYWIEDSTNTSVDVWVFIDYVPASGANIYMYYGNPSVGSDVVALGSSDYPGISCRAINMSATTADGVYYIDPNAQESADKFQVYCDLNADAGGWSLIMKSKADTSTFHYSSGYWTTANTYQATDLNEDVGDSKFEIFNTFPFISLRGCVGSATDNCMVRTFSSDKTSAMALFNETETSACIDTDDGGSLTFDDFETVFSINMYDGLCEAGPVFNKPDCGPGGGDNPVRWGVYTDEDVLCVSNNEALGWGLTNDGTAPGSAGSGGYVSRMTHAGKNTWLWVRDSVFSTAGYTVSAGSPASEEKGPGPVAYWKFDEGVDNTCTGGTNDVCDSTTGGADGTLVGASWRNEDMCISGKCLEFIAATDKVNFTTDFSEITDEITVSAWVRPTEVPDGQGRLVVSTYYYSASDPDMGWTLGNNYGSGDEFYFRVWNSAGSYASAQIDNFFTTYDDQWVHVLGVYDSSSYAKLYINGQEVASDTSSVPSAIAYNGVNMRIGSRCQTDTQGRWKGFIDGVKIHDYALTDAQIQAEYLASQSTSPSGVTASFGGGQQQNQSEGLIAYWDMDESSGDILDSSGNDNTGIVTGTTVVGGKYGNGRSFNGSSDYVTIPFSRTKTIQPGETISTWVYREGVGAGSSAGIVHIMGSTDNNHQSGIITSSTDDDYVKCSGSYEEDTVAKGINSPLVSLPVSTWIHIVCVYDYDGTDMNISIYKNGIFGGSSSDVVDSYDYTSNNIKIGIQKLTASRYFNGKIDDVKIYNVARLADQIMRDYKRGPGPVLDLSMEENSGDYAYDRSANGNNAQLGEGTADKKPSWVLGKYGGALSFDGDGDYLNIPITTSLQPRYQITMEAWVNPVDYSGDMILMSTYYMIVDNSGQLETYWSGKSSQGYHSSGTAGDVPIGEWSHIAAVWDDSYARLFVNGVEKNSVASSGMGDAAVNQVWIGAESDGTTRKFNGKIDNVKIYNYARTQEQILWDMYGDESNYPMVELNFNEGYGSTTKNSGYLDIDSTLCNSPTWTTDGKFNNGINFDGLNDYAILSHNTLFDYMGEDKTYSFWMRADAGETGGWMLSKPWNGNGEYNYSFEWSGSSTILFRLDGTGNSQTIATTTPMTTGVWYHVVMTLDSVSKMRTFYINGVKDNSGVHTFTSMLPDNPDINASLNIGTLYNYNCNGWVGAAAHAFDGKIDDFKIFNYKLSPEQVQQEFNQGSQATLGQQKDSSETWDAGGFGGNAPVAYWDFEEGSGSTAQDVSGNSHAGTITGADYGLGEIGWGLEFDGSGDYITTDGDEMNASDDVGTLEVWVKSLDPSASEGIFSTAENRDRRIYLESSVFNASMYDDVYGAHRIVSGGVVDQQWHHVSFSWDINNGNLELYVDGSLVDGYSGASWTTTSAANPTYYGYQHAGGSGAPAVGDFTGILDGAKVFDYVRTSAQVAYDYNGGKPVGWWRFNEGEGIITRDNSGNGNTGTLTTMDPATDWLDGANCKFEGCLDFDGTSDYINIPDNDVLDFGAGDFSLALWFKEDGGTNEMFLSKEAGQPLYRLHINSNSQIRYVIRDTAGNENNGSGDKIINDNVWHHVVATFDRDSVAIIYVDGFVDGTPESIASTTGDISSGGSLQIGVLTTDTALFNGLLDDVRIYNYVLTATQVQEVMNYGSVYLK